MRITDNVSAEDHVYVPFLEYSGAHNLGSWLQHMYTRSNIMHVQVAFFVNNKFITYTSDATVGYVYRVDDKQWSRRGWKFYAIPVGRKVRQAMMARAESLRGTPYDVYTVCNFFCIPMGPTPPTKVSCVHFTMLVLQAGGLFCHLDEAVTTDASLEELISGLACVKKNAWIVDNGVASIDDKEFAEYKDLHPATDFYVSAHDREEHHEEEPPWHEPGLIIV